MGRKMFRATVVLTFLAPGLAGAQSMDGWQRLPDLQLAFERDHAACTAQSKPRPALADGLGAPSRLGTMGATIDTATARGIALGLAPGPGVRPVPGLPTGGTSGDGGLTNMAKPVPLKPSFDACMRSKGWVKGAP
jgi:hypothetical protein